MRVLVCGGRDYRNKVKVWGWLQAVHLKRGIECIIHGDATGADTLAGGWAEAEKVQVETYPADWRKLGLAAGPIRNRRMIEEGKPDLVVAFSGGRGTADMVSRAKRAGIKVTEVKEDEG